jgi:hypothetical protein
VKLTASSEIIREPETLPQVKDEPSEPTKRKKEEPFSSVPELENQVLLQQETPPKEGEKKKIRIQIQIHRVEKTGAGVFQLIHI